MYFMYLFKYKAFYFSAMILESALSQPNAYDTSIQAV